MEITRDILNINNKRSKYFPRKKISKTYLKFQVVL